MAIFGIALTKKNKQTKFGFLMAQNNEAKNKQKNSEK